MDPIQWQPGAGPRGALVRVAATFEDVTERKNSEIALKESQRLFQRTADALQIGLALRQRNMPRFLFVSKKYMEIMGFDPEAGSSRPSSPPCGGCIPTTATELWLSTSG